MRKLTMPSKPNKSIQPPFVFSIGPAAIAVAMLFSVTANGWAQSTSTKVTQAKPTAPPMMAAPTALTSTPTAAPIAARASAIQTVDAIAAVVNSDVITRNELTSRMRDIVQRMKTQGIEVPPEAELRKQMLERLILEKAEIQSAREQGLSVDDRMLDTAIARIAE
ncbi:MAG: SurA N-terminal domain-containing protein, partial [Glaciimonas sp.]|nr:SurA N-terminal domain-containing protein [Glaciimonas sp.]